VKREMKIAGLRSKSIALIYFSDFAAGNGGGALAEYGGGGAPFIAAQDAGLLEIGRSADGFVLKYRRRVESGAELAYTIERSDDLRQWLGLAGGVISTEGDPERAGFERVDHSLPDNSAAKSFLRLQISL